MGVDIELYKLDIMNVFKQKYSIYDNRQLHTYVMDIRTQKKN